jgi:hypothetical protein
MIYLLIKAKSGLHAGATWRFEKSTFSLGASSKADVFLCDPGVPDTLIKFRKVGRKIRIEGLNDEARLRSLDNRDVSDILLPSQAAILDFRQVQIEIQVLAATYNVASALGDRFAYLFQDLLQLLRNLGVKAFFGLLFLMGILMTGLVLFFGTAGVVKSEASIPKKTVQQENYPVTPNPPQFSMQQHMARNVAQEMRDFAQRIDAKYFDVQLNDTQVQIEAQLSRLQAVQFEQHLNRQGRDYGQHVDIRAKLSFTQEQKTIDSLEVERIMLGTRPAIVLRDGSMLYVGGSFNGMDVVSIGPRKVVLKGAATYEVVL